MIAYTNIQNTKSQSEFVQIADSTQQLQRIYQFRYAVESQELGKEPNGIDHQRRIVYDDWDESGTHYFIESKRQLVAAMRRNTLDTLELSKRLQSAFQLSTFGDWAPHQLGISSKLMIASNSRGSLYRKLLVKSFEDARTHGTLFEFQYCRPKLVRFYARLGFHQLGKPFLWNGESYVPMVSALADMQHFQTVRSPFLKVAQRYPHADSTEWFHQSFGHLHRRNAERQCRRQCLSCHQQTSCNA